MSGYIIIKDKHKEKIVVGSDAICQLLIRQCAEKLLQAYPTHPWYVKMSSDKGLIYIYNMLVSIEYGFVLKTAQVQNDPELKCVVRAGGEILERAFLSRTNKPQEMAKKLDLQGMTTLRNNDKKNAIKRLIRNG